MLRRPLWVTVRTYSSLKTKPSLLIATEVGNMYTPSLFGGLASFISGNSVENLAGKCVGLFSYGLGLAATMFSLQVTQDIGPDSLIHFVASLQGLQQHLGAQHKVSLPEFAEATKLRQDTHNKVLYNAVGSVDQLFPGTCYLTRVDEMHCRQYVAGNVATLHMKETSSATG